MGAHDAHHCQPTARAAHRRHPTSSANFLYPSLYSVGFHGLPFPHFSEKFHWKGRGKGKLAWAPEKDAHDAHHCSTPTASQTAASAAHRRDGQHTSRPPAKRTAIAAHRRDGQLETRTPTNTETTTTMDSKQDSKPFEEQWMRADEYRAAYGGFTLVDLVPGTETRTAKGSRKMLAKAPGQPDRLAIVSKDKWGRWSVVISRDPYTPPRPRYRDEREFLASLEGPSDGRLLPGIPLVYEELVQE